MVLVRQSCCAEPLATPRPFSKYNKRMALGEEILNLHQGIGTKDWESFSTWSFSLSDAKLSVELNNHYGLILESVCLYSPLFRHPSASTNVDYPLKCQLSLFVLLWHTLLISQAQSKSRGQQVWTRRFADLLVNRFIGQRKTICFCYEMHWFFMKNVTCDRKIRIEFFFVCLGQRKTSNVWFGKIKYFLLTGNFHY